MPTPNEIIWYGVPYFQRPSCVNNFCTSVGIKIVYTTDWKLAFTDERLDEIGATLYVDSGVGPRVLEFKTEKHKLAFILKWS
jgi:hypothetical protein